MESMDGIKEREGFVRIKVGTGAKGGEFSAYISNEEFYAEPSDKLDAKLKRIAQAYTKLSEMVGK